MKRFAFVLIIAIIFGCNSPTQKVNQLQNRIDSLEQRLNDTYKPGFGEFMSGIQAHHSKLWFAGQNQNWKLADFEIHEIMESIGDIQKYETERPESKLIKMIEPALDSVNSAIKQKNQVRFTYNFTLLTKTCNACHQAANFEFNVVKIPESLPFSNQDFKVNEQK
jgi:hypothetical protein